MKSNPCNAAFVTLAALACLLLGGSLALAQMAKYPVGIRGKYTPDGMLVLAVDPGTPAARAGLQEGDLVLKIDGRLVTSQEEFVRVIDSSGGEVLFVVQKGKTGQTVRVPLDLVATGTGKQVPPSPYYLGAYGNYTRDGMLVTGTTVGGAAARLGVEKGDVIVRVNNLPIANQNEFSTVLTRSRGVVSLQVKKANGRTVKLDADLPTYELGVIGEHTRDGVVVGDVVPGLPAVAVGLRKGDQIQRIDNQPVPGPKEADQLLADSGGTVTLLVRRGLAPPMRVAVELRNNPLGAWCEPNRDGLRVTVVTAGSVAATAGLDRGDTIVKVDGQAVRTNGDLIDALRLARGLARLTVHKPRADRLVRLEVELPR